MKSEILKLIKGYKNKEEVVMSKIKTGGNDITLTILGTEAKCYRSIIAELEYIIKSK